MKRYVALGAIAFAAAAGQLVLKHPLFAIIGGVVIFVSTAEMFLPMKFSLSANGAQQKCGISTTEITWADVKRLIHQSDGIRLSPFEKSHRLDAFRGVYLRFAGNKEEVLGKIAELWETDAELLARGTDTGTGE